MATLAERNDNWNARGIIRRDFRHTHDGPEVPPHKPSKKYKKKHKHVFVNGPSRQSYKGVSYTVYVYNEYCDCGLARERRRYTYHYDSVPR